MKDEQCRDCWFYAMRNSGDTICTNPLSEYALLPITEENGYCILIEPFDNEAKAMLAQDAWRRAMGIN